MIMIFLLPSVELMGVEDALQKVAHQKTGNVGCMRSASRDYQNQVWNCLPIHPFVKRAGTSLPLPDKQNIMFADFRRDPDQYPLKTPSGKIEIFSSTVASFAYDDCPGHLGPHRNGWALRKILILYICSRTSPEQNCTASLIRVPLRQLQKLRDAKKLQMHKDDAAARGIEEGDIIRLFNARGAIYVGVRITDKDKAWCCNGANRGLARPG